jgi:hypothetical protein
MTVADLQHSINEYLKGGLDPDAQVLVDIVHADETADTYAATMVSYHRERRELTVSAEVENTPQT